MLVNALVMTLARKDESWPLPIELLWNVVFGGTFLLLESSAQRSIPGLL
jgi:hypothetical protein